ncbi:MAG: hypothetical protein HN742_41445 [Lentisphaerae bacterium]|jgi:modulator of FtsH protease HflK|nr:hypothetical protein [Lentisphaerota bacterium]MBT4817464.1 hypothetical protein [Lentisphaerota bacterium]MBT5612753.1 hypothetical protein [Lentisphaerota bacterium]MBT7058982.1 hypothetical protein [Lentisphaerota bacterium]MBT7848402.1 hypothetical protein [Lentisphaerota bacterium]
MNVEQQQPVGDQNAEGLRALAGALRLIIRLLIGGVVLLMLVSLMQCCAIVKQHQVGVVYRFGRPARRLQPGDRALIFPPPIDRYHAYTVTRERVVSTDAFMYARSEDATRTGANDPIPPVLRPGLDGYLLTGDGDIVHCRASLYYRIADPVLFYELHADGEAALAAFMREAVLAVSASLSTDTTLFRPAEFSDRTAQRLRHRLEAAGMGVLINRVVLTALPPRQVKSAFDAQVAVGQTVDQLLQEAKSYRERVSNEATSSADRIRALARADGERLKQTAQARVTNYEKLLAEYRKNPDVVKRELYIQTVQRILHRADEVYFVDGQEGRQVRISLGRQRGTPHTKAAEQGTRHE